ncbi:MAG: NfeD family protein [Rariglobus sp.]|nr:NfeD family protein [Rariglobus sp.]
MSAVILLFVVGILLLGVEVFVPGGILGILGGVAMLCGCIVAFKIFGMEGGLIASGVAAAILGGTLYFEFVLLPKTSLGRSLMVLAPSRPTPAESAKDVGLVGQTALADTVLAPTGYVLVANTRHEAVSQSGLIQKGASVSIVAHDGFRLIVSSNN